MRFISFLAFLVLCTLAACARERQPVLEGSLFEGDKFTSVEDFTDEFSGSFNHDKWYDNNPRWKGRQPGLFASKNVKQKRGKLFLKGRYEKKNSNAFDGAPEGYETYTTSFVMTKKNARYGYFEVKAKPGNSRLSSSFWGSLDTPTLWTEIDVYEIGGGAVYDGIDYRRRINMNLHVFRHKKKGIEPGMNEISKPTYHVHSSFLRSRFNVYGLDWNKKHITWTFNGRAIRRDRNRWWKQAFPMKFDVETMPFWFGLPSKRTLPATYKIKYIRAWSRKTTSSSTDTVRMARRSVLPNISTRQFSNMFGMHTPRGAVDGDDGEDDPEDDSAEMEVHTPTEPETNAPQDGLQRPPIPGSNERVYSPVVPLFGGTWGNVIQHQDAIMDDVFGSEFAPGEAINQADFDEELTFFGAPASTPAPGPAAGPAPAPAPQPAPAPAAPAPAPSSGSSEKPSGIFGGAFKSFPWG